VLAAAQAVLDESPKLDVDYLALVDPATFAPAVTGPAVLAVAARAGATRLIDNALVDLGGPVAARH
jgi:pantoate--beta-alanine ligase